MRRSKNSGGIHGTEDEKPKRDEAPFGALMVGGAEMDLNSFKTASGEILPDEGQLLCLVSYRMVASADFEDMSLMFTSL